EQAGAPGGTEAAAAHGLLDLAGLAIQGFAKVHLVASSLAIVLWSVAILRGGALHRAAGWAGLVAGGGVLVSFFFGGLHLDVHGFGHMVLLQAAWLVTVGALLWRGREPLPAAGTTP
ncbi:MAG TPA: hypothetical protein VFF36_06320, partial [Planctomycetota bacterium]|nr:hypothetical protein [Planctomycetota bacterium]